MTDPQYEGCTCTPEFLRFNYCGCGARRAHLEARAAVLIPSLSSNQIEALIEVTGAIDLRTWNRLYRTRERRDLEGFGISTGFSRSGDNAITLTDLGKVIQEKLREAVTP